MHWSSFPGSIPVNGCRIELSWKVTILLSNVSVILYKAGSYTGVENNKLIQFNLSAATYSIDSFNEKIKEAVL